MLGLAPGVFAAWRHRSLLARVLIAATALLVATPVGLTIAATAVLGKAAAPAAAPAAAARPMSTWVVTQEFGCTGVAIEPPAPGCAHFHSGIDLAAPAGTAVAAVLAGVAWVVRSAGGLGLHVVVRHPGGVSTYYGHLALVDVFDGEAVEAGTVLGIEGSSGNSTGPHLHFEVQRDGVPLPPREVFPSLFGPGMDNGRGGSAAPTTGRT